MRKVPFRFWKESDSDGKEVQGNNCLMIEAILASRDPQKMPKGIDQFRFFGRITKACDEAPGIGFIIFEEADYSQLKKFVEEGVPSHWAKHPDIAKAVEEFISIEQEK
jgi:hypothetical protein